MEGHQEGQDLNKIQVLLSGLPCYLDNADAYIDTTWIKWQQVTRVLCDWQMFN